MQQSKNHITTLDPPILIGHGVLLSGILLLVISAAWGFLVIGPAYYSAVIISGVLTIIGLGLIFRAMDSTDLSLSMPMLFFTPVFLIGTSCFLLHEARSRSNRTFNDKTAQHHLHYALRDSLLRRG
jgi:drug/metabolite transporter (DMT)-like permease